MKQKKILLLGGSYGQIPAIREAKKRNLNTVLCDYLPDNPGKRIADKFYLVSTTDKEKILDVASAEEVDFVMAYASDPAALTAAYVSKEMGLFGNTPESVERLANKDLFRSFQEINQFNTPQHFVLSESGDFRTEEIQTLLPVVVKPVDSSDSKGVTKVDELADLQTALKYAFSVSRSGKVILEKFVDCSIARLHGDAFMVDGKMEFCLLGDQFCMSASAPLKPTSTVFPSVIDDGLMKRVHYEVEKHLQLSGYKNGPVNIEVRVNHKNEIYVMEIGPRSGGILTPESVFLYSGFDTLDAQFKQQMGEEIQIQSLNEGCVIRFTLFSDYNGIFEDFSISDDLKSHVRKFELYTEPGDNVHSMDNSGANIGVIILQYNSLYEAPDMNELVQKINSKLKIKAIEK